MTQTLTKETEVTEKALTVVEKALEIKITDAVTYTMAGETWKVLAALEKEVKDTFTPIKEKAWAAHKEVVAKEKQHLDPIVNAKKHVKAIMSDYDHEQERIRVERQRQIEEQLRKEEEERKLQEAIEAEASGHVEEAESILQEPVYVAPVVLQKQTPKLSGGPVYRENWSFEITDATKIPREYLQPDTVKIGQVVRAMKNMTNIPGIRAFSRRV